MLSALDPGKQGLKLLENAGNVRHVDILSALDPGKQGLKLPRGVMFARGRPLSALDPGKQGLKLFRVKWKVYSPICFQRLIQENKD